MSSSEPEKAASSLTCFVIGPIGNRLAAVGTPEREAYEDSLRIMEEVISDSPDVPVGHVTRPGRGGQSPERVSLASAMSASAE